MLPLPSGACCQPPGPGAGAVWPLLQTLCPFCTLPWKESRPPARVFSGVPSPRSTIQGVSLEDVTLGAMSPRYSGFSQDTGRVGSVPPILLPIASALSSGRCVHPRPPPALPSCTCSGHTGSLLGLTLAFWEQRADGERRRLRRAKRVTLTVLQAPPRDPRQSEAQSLPSMLLARPEPAPARTPPRYFADEGGSDCPRDLERPAPHSGLPDGPREPGGLPQRLGGREGAVGTEVCWAGGRRMPRAAHALCLPPQLRALDRGQRCKPSQDVAGLGRWWPRGLETARNEAWSP